MLDLVEVHTHFANTYQVNGLHRAKVSQPYLQFRKVLVDSCRELRIHLLEIRLACDDAIDHAA